MWTAFNNLRDITFASVSVRMILVLLCGGLIGIEREFRRRPAGFRTHILICLGAAITTMTGEYLFLVLGYYTDVLRLGAQVIAGIGFIGGGTIIMNPDRKVVGLTTAAGLWAVAIVGLCLGAGFYEGGIIATILILLAELVFSRIERRIVSDVPEFKLHIVYQSSSCLKKILDLCHVHGLQILNIKVTKNKDGEEQERYADFHLGAPGEKNEEQIIQEILGIEGVMSVAKQ